MYQQRKRITIFIGIFVLVAVGLVYGSIPVFAADSDIIVSEVMFKPDATNAIEWVEIYNKGATPVDLTGWTICDDSGCDALSGIIPAGDYWVVTEAADAPTLQLEFNTYAGTPMVDPMRTIFINQAIGSNSLGNNDAVSLDSGVGLSDCVSWGSSTFCSMAMYLPGSNGVDTGISGLATALGQPIVNIGGIWQRGGDNSPTPYALNVADGGSPTAITLNAINARNTPTLIASAGIIGTLMAVISGWLVMRRKSSV